jgi:hypothetical protein
VAVCSIDCITGNVYGTTANNAPSTVQYSTYVGTYSRLRDVNIEPALPQDQPNLHAISPIPASPPSNASLQTQSCPASPLSRRISTVSRLQIMGESETGQVPRGSASASSNEESGLVAVRSACRGGCRRPRIATVNLGARYQNSWHPVSSLMMFIHHEFHTQVAGRTTGHGTRELTTSWKRRRDIQYCARLAARCVTSRRPWRLVSFFLFFWTVLLLPALHSCQKPRVVRARYRRALDEAPVGSFGGHVVHESVSCCVFLWQGWRTIAFF